jgi:hypothetical protein
MGRDWRARCPWHSDSEEEEEEETEDPMPGTFVFSNKQGNLVELLLLGSGSVAIDNHGSHSWSDNSLDYQQQQGQAFH